ncbi:hypothetical protein TRVL_02413 [Trypanosoma vivax]|nr:hypothetical protein TRVL_02413 [Trypanosoma vivax]
MSEPELSELIRKFQAIQQQDVSNQISERNVVEIINVLRTKGLVELIYTVDGKEYLTWDQLRREVIDEVYVNGGRINVVDIHGLLNVHAVHVERILPEVLEDRSLRIENGEVISDTFLNSAVQGAADLLNEQGFISITDFAKTHRFTSLFAEGILTDAVASGRLVAVIEGNMLYTKQFVWSQKVILRAGLLAATQPVNLESFFERHKLFSPLMASIIEAVSHELPGKVEGGRTYVPSCFELARTEQVENVYLSNGFIDYAVLHRQGITHAREFLVARYNPVAKDAPAAEGSKKRGRRAPAAADTTVKPQPVARSESHPNAGHALSSCFVSDRLLANIVVFEELANGDGLLVNLAEHLPSSVDFEKDLDILMRRLREQHPIVASCTLIGGSMLIHESAWGIIRERLRVVFEDHIKERAKRKGKNKGADGAEFGKEQEEALLRVVAEVTALSLEEYQDTLEELTAHFGEPARQMYSELASSAEQHVPVEWKRTRAQLQASIGVAWIDLVVAEKGLVWASTRFDEPVFTSLNRHLLSTRALPLVRDILLNESLDNPSVYERVSDVILEQVEGHQQPTAATLQRMLKAIPDSQRQGLSPIVEASTGKSVESFRNLLQELCGAGQIAVSCFHQPNKKVEREALAAMRQRVTERVAADSFTTDATRSGTLFALVCTLILHTQFHVHVDLPGRAVGSVVALLATVATELAGSLKDCNQIIAGAIGGKELSDADLEKLEHLRETALNV